VIPGAGLMGGTPLASVLGPRGLRGLSRVAQGSSSRGHEPCGSRGALPAGSGRPLGLEPEDRDPQSLCKASDRGRARLAHPLATSSPTQPKWAHARGVTGAQALGMRRSGALGLKESSNALQEGPPNRTLCVPPAVQSLTVIAPADRVLKQWPIVSYQPSVDPAPHY
jgi:hypothetical protein